jgi:hypothetical protein
MRAALERLHKFDLQFRLRCNGCNRRSFFIAADRATSAASRFFTAASISAAMELAAALSLARSQSVRDNDR